MMLVVQQRVENKVVLKQVEESPSACRKLGGERMKQERDVLFEGHRKEEELNSFFKDAEILTY